MCKRQFGHTTLGAAAHWMLRREGDSGLAESLRRNRKSKHHKIALVPRLWAEVAMLKFNPDPGR
jgi:hypothetical protein